MFDYVNHKHKTNSVLNNQNKQEPKREFVKKPCEICDKKSWFIFVIIVKN